MLERVRTLLEMIRFSHTLFALPFAVFAPLAGRLADHLDRRWLAGGAVLASCAFAATYPFLTSVSWLLGLGTAEAIATVAAYPAAQSLLTQAATPETQGRAQGFFTTAETASIATAATVGGAMFAGNVRDQGPVEVIPPDGKDVKLLTYVFANGLKIFHAPHDPDGIGRGVRVVGTPGGSLRFRQLLPQSRDIAAQFQKFGRILV